MQRNIFIYDFAMQEGEYLGELAQRSIGKIEKIVQWLKFNNHIIRTTYIDSFFKCFRCCICDCFFNRSDNFNILLLRCKDRVRHCTQRTSMSFAKPCLKSWKDSFFQFLKKNKLINNLAIFNFESICSATEKLKETQTTAWIGNHTPI